MKYKKPHFQCKFEVGAAHRKSESVHTTAGPRAHMCAPGKDSDARDGGQGRRRSGFVHLRRWAESKARALLR
eukprot:472019-Rhodomonas_salina.1